MLKTTTSTAKEPQEVLGSLSNPQLENKEAPNHHSLIKPEEDTAGEIEERLSKSRLKPTKLAVKIVSL